MQPENLTVVYVDDIEGRPHTDITGMVSPSSGNFDSLNYYQRSACPGGLLDSQLRLTCHLIDHPSGVNDIKSGQNCQTHGG